MSDSKIQIKVGIVEFSGEGNQDWLAKQLDKILEKIPELLKLDVISPQKPIDQNTSVNDISGKTTLGLSLLNIAGKLNCKSGGDLAIAAAAFLHFAEGKAAFSRDEISSTMKKATGFYKDTMMNNLTKTLSQLEKSGTFTKSSNLYSIQATKVTELNAILSR
ncbi:hypothetical protein HDF18_10525 [Mucilaginibacter sp. X5P1]|uniref:hypothetical protein n=1 Tax=Mucilaginibacter sp. X5P1 TaxID=2723088 RepID=UPI0016178788|nr:hypothetical protein [Mucilaginibacter sp. X5P1]MBB6140744.1 hypothetical protein [Mucilaginibacter sp. X5P1]